MSSLPDSELCVAAISYARSVSEPFLFHHVMRSAMYADAIGRARGARYDREVLCVAAVLHDLGLTRVAPVRARFEVEGADAAKEFLLRQGMTEKNVELVWDAIALHTTVDIPLRKAPEIALCFLGIAADLSLTPPGLVDVAIVRAALEEHPWETLDEQLPRALVALYERDRVAASSNAVADACERTVQGFARFNLCDHLRERSRPIAAR